MPVCACVFVSVSVCVSARCACVLTVMYVRPPARVRYPAVRVG